MQSTLRNNFKRVESMIKKSERVNSYENMIKFCNQGKEEMVNVSKEFLTAKDISNILEISYVNALNFIKFSGIQYLKIGNQYRVLTENFDKFTHSRGNRIVRL